MKEHICIILVGALLFWGCDRSANEPDNLSLFENHAPIVDSITVITQNIQALDTITVSCVAFDPDGDVLNYFWTATTGTFKGVNGGTIHNDTVSWIAGNDPFQQTIFVRANDKELDGNGARDVWVNPAPPEPPSKLFAEVLSVNSIRITWQDNSVYEEGFIIERGSEEFGSFSIIDTVGIDITEFTDIGLTANTVYWYKLKAYNASGNSPYSSPTSEYTVLLPSDGLIAYYRFNGNALDSSPNSNNNGTPFNVIYAQDRFSRYESAANLNAQSGYIVLPISLLEIQDCTVTGWMKWTEITADQPLFYAEADDGRFFKLTPKSSSGSYKLTLSDGVTTESLSNGPPPPINITTSWIFVAFTLEGDQGTLYKNNGAELMIADQKMMTLDPEDINAEEFGIGGTSTSLDRFKGSVDDVRIFNRALTQPELELLLH